MPIRPLGLALLLSLPACSATISHESDIAAPQRYRPEGSAAQWLIEAELDNEVHRYDFTGDQTIASRTLSVTINGETAVVGALPKDDAGLPAGTLDGKYGDAEVHVDCSSQRKTWNWIELRCRVLVDDELAVTLVM